MIGIAMVLQLAAQDAPPPPRKPAPPVVVQVPAARTTVVRPAPDEELNDANICGALGQFVKNNAPLLPAQVDAVTRLDSFVLSCPDKRLANRVTMLVRIDQMQPGWQARKQIEWSKHICSNPNWMTIYRLGWRFSQNMTFEGGEIVTLDAECGS